MNRQMLYVCLSAILFATPPLWAWREMDISRQRATNAMRQLDSTRSAVQSIVHTRSVAPPDASESFGQADAVRLVNSALVDAGLSPSTASELTLRDDSIRANGQETGRLQRLSIRLRPVEPVQLGRTLQELSKVLPSFTPADINLQRPGGLSETETRYGVDIVLERQYISAEEENQR
ncbi:MAG: hypothetical protein ED559_05105 [Phycisphaera sp.]|nr:MAG: hypothetical protein ED559_05105 [Phycisphaera sp.]